MPRNHQLPEPIWAIIPGTLAEAKASIFHSVGQYLRRNLHAKVGITNNPYTRWNKHKADGWEKMVVIYRSRRRSDLAKLQDVRTVECEIIDHIKNYSRAMVLEYNEIAGGGGRISSGEQYVYLLLSGPWKKRSI